MPGIVIEIIGDERSYLRAAENTLAINTKLAASTSTLGRSFKQVGVDATLSADAQIKAAVRAQQALRANAEALASRASSLPAGSVEQLTATRLAAAEQAKLARSYGVTGRAAGLAGGNIEKAASRGAGAIHRLGSSILAVGGGFLAFQGISDLFRGSIEGAASLEKAQRGLDAAIKHTHGSLAELGPRYDATALAAQRFGVDQADALTALERATVLTGNAEAAQRAYTEALVISKATGKDFNAVLTATSKGQEGVVTSLQRYGILVKKGETGQQQLNQVMARFGGQARANTSGIDVFNATLHNSEEIIGSGILPVLNRYLGELGSWLDRMNRSGQLQRDVNRDVHEAADVIHAAAGAIRTVDHVTGSFVHTLELLLGLKVASRILSWSIALSKLERNAGAAQGALAGSTGVAGGIGGVATKAEGATSRVARLTKALNVLSGLTVVATVEVIGLETLKDKVFGLQKLAQGAAANAPQYGDLYKHVASEILALERKGVKPKDVAERIYKEYGGQGAGQEKLLAEAFQYLNEKRGQKATGYLKQVEDEQAKARSERQRRRTHAAAIADTFALPYVLRLAEAKAVSTVGTKDDVAVDRRIRAYVLSRIPRLHGDALVSAYQELGQVNQQIATDLHKAVKNAKRAREFTIPASLQLAEARAQALGLPDTSILLKMRAAAYKALRSHKLSIQGQIDDWNLIASLNEQLGAFRYGPLPRHGVGAFGYAIGRDDRPIVIHHHTHLDGREVEHSVTRHQQKRRRRNSSQRRGPNAG